MIITDYLYNNNCPVRYNDETPIAYTAASIALATHIHPIQALQILFSDEEVLSAASDYDTCIACATDVVNAYELSVFGNIGDLSEDFRVVGHLESLASSLMILLRNTGMTLNDMNSSFERNQIWEKMACSGKSWVSSGIDWTASYLQELC